MSAENNYQEILEKVCEKLNNINVVTESDIPKIKNSLESVGALLANTQAIANFREIKEKLENIAFQVDSTNDTLLKDFYNDINNLKAVADNVNNYLHNVYDLQNHALTKAEFEEYQEQQWQFTITSNETVFNALKEIKESAGIYGNSVSFDTGAIKNIENRLNIIHDSLKGYINNISQNSGSNLSLDAITGVVSDLNSVTNKGIKQTNILIKEVQAELLKLHSDFQNRNLMQQISKISEIYDSLNAITSWVERVGYINQTIENIYAKLGENVDFDDISGKIDIIYESINTLNNWTIKIDKFDTLIPEMNSKLGSFSTVLTDIKNIINTLDSFKEHLNSIFSEELDFTDLANKIDIVYENVAALNQWAMKIDSILGKLEEGAKDIASVKENINGVSDGLLGVSEKVNIIADNIETVSGSIRSISDDINVLSDKITGISDKSSEINGVSDKVNSVEYNVNNVSEKVNSVDYNVNTVLEKVDNVTGKIDDISGKVADVLNSVVAFSDNTNSSANVSNGISNDFEYNINNVSEKVDNIANSVIALQNNANLALERDEYIAREISNVTFKVDDVLSSIVTFSDSTNAFTDNFSGIAEKVNGIDFKLDDITNRSNDILNGVVSFTDSSNALADNLNGIFDKVNGVEYKLNDVTGRVEDVLGSVITLSDNTNNSLTDHFNGISDKVNGVQDNLSNVSSKVDDITSSVITLQDNSNLLLEKNENITHELGVVSGKVEDVLNNIVNFSANREPSTENFDGISQKINGVEDILSNISGKVDSVSEKMYSFTESINSVVGNVGSLCDNTVFAAEKYDNISQELGNVTGKIYEISDKVDDAVKNIINLNENRNSEGNGNFSKEFENISDKINTLSEKVAEISEKSLEIGVVSGMVDAVSGKVENVLQNITDSSDGSGVISSQIENVSGKAENIIYSIGGMSDSLAYIDEHVKDVSENVSSVCDKVNDFSNKLTDKIENLSQNNKELCEKYNATNENINEKIDEIKNTIIHSGEIMENIPDLKGKLEDLSKEFYTITKTTKNDTETYIYTLLDIESDFLKLQRVLENTTQATTKDIGTLKERFTELDDDISSVSVRTNRLILAAEETNKTLKTHLESFNNTIKVLDEKVESFNPEYKYGLLDKKTEEMLSLLQKSVKTAESLNRAFAYLADWIDATGSIISDIQKNTADIEEIKALVEKLPIDIQKSIKLNTEEISADIKKNTSMLSEEIKNSTLEVNKTINKFEKSFKNFKEDDIEIIKQALSFLVNNVEEVDLRESLERIEASIDNSDVQDIITIKDTVAAVLSKIGVLEDSFSDFRSEEFSDVRSSLTGIMVQLNTALTPHIDILNERIDKLEEQNRGHLSELETLMREKINEQAKHISSLEEKIEVMNAKFDKMYEMFAEKDNNSGIKDILNYITGQIATVNENVTIQQNNQQNNGEVLAVISDNMAKLVSYLEEE